ncbi:ankyrin repeat-containing protein [Acanthamoeba castellanii str. Neff]|uniref:Ankyrin repeat-containing protein n=1 Tax=Acanthamoeba castellanii (strain ATCC 30010 / Neff) TaxID=1257118 RepID=L8GVB4_ACACF|nr:ankyrin repeat-containing protein [Acanthamoeba castellanii str. Neff]ELR16538.1 ankyrin repeat-containing protein [Acanthamoeba castellanii str. Neff]
MDSLRGGERGWGTFTVGIAVEFKGGKEPPLELRHALSFDEGGQWTEIALPVSRAAEAPGRSDKMKEKKMKTKQQHATSHDQLFSAIVTNEPKARLQLVQPFLTAESVNLTLDGDCLHHSDRYRGTKVTLLHLAAFLSDHGLVEALLAAGADPNLPLESLQRSYEYQQRKGSMGGDFFAQARGHETRATQATALHLALLNEHHEMAARLLLAGASPWLTAGRLSKSQGSHCSSWSLSFINASAFHMACYSGLSSHAQFEAPAQRRHPVPIPGVSQGEEKTNKGRVTKKLCALLIASHRLAGCNVNEPVGSPDNGTSSSTSIEGATPLALLINSSSSSRKALRFADDLLAIGADPAITCASRTRRHNYDGHEGSGGSSEEWRDFNCLHLAVLLGRADFVRKLIGLVVDNKANAEMKIVTVDQPHRSMFDYDDELFGGGDEEEEEAEANDPDAPKPAPRRRAGRGGRRKKGKSPTTTTCSFTAAALAREKAHDAEIKRLLGV